MDYKEWCEVIADYQASHPMGLPLDANGAELPNPVPVAPPVGYKKQPSMFEVVRDMVRAERMRVLEEEGFESPEDADDFNVGDDDDPTSPYEYDFDHIADPAELQRLRDLIDIRERELRADSSPAGQSAPGTPAAASSAAAPPRSSPSE